MKNIYIMLCMLGLSIIMSDKANACTRVVYTGSGGLVVTGRTMDWKTEMESNIWAFPRGMARSGEAGANSVKWTSKYGSVVTSAFEIASTDGINEKGLVANLLWLNESAYPERDRGKPGLTIAAWVQFMLDNFATVDEAVSYAKQNSFQVVSDQMPDGSRPATLHLSISDATGDSAIFEYIDGELQVYHNRDYKVMTNSPTFDKQLALDDYWEQIGGLTFLPGTNRAADRFARASFYIKAIPQTDNAKIGIASVFSVIRNVSVPYGISVPDRPEIATTQWRTVADSKNLLYFFESSITPNVFWIKLKDLDLSEGAPVLKLDISNGEIYDGNAVNYFKPAEAFKFLGIQD